MFWVEKKGTSVCYMATELAPRPNRSISCNVRLMSDICLSLPCHFLSERDGDFESKRFYLAWPKIEVEKHRYWLFLVFLLFLSPSLPQMQPSSYTLLNLLSKCISWQNTICWWHVIFCTFCCCIGAPFRTRQEIHWLLVCGFLHLSWGSARTQDTQDRSNCLGLFHSFTKKG